MAYRSGNITNADPAAALIAAIEGTFDDHTGNWEAVETVTSTVAYNVWRNRGTTVTNPNSWGTDFYLAIGKISTTAIRIKVFESWDGTADRMIRPVVALSTKAVNANFSYGDETGGYALNDTTNSASAGWSGLATTGFDYFIRASKDNLCIGIKQGVSDDFFSLGVFESFLTTSPSESFPLYLSQARPVAGGGIAADTTGFQATAVNYAFSRHPNVTATQTDNFKGAGQFTALGPLVGGIDASTTVDRLHNSSWLWQRPSVQMLGGFTGSAPQTYGQYRGQIYDVALLTNNGATTRTGDTVTFGGDVYVKMGNTAGVWWAKRDAV